MASNVNELYIVPKEVYEHCNKPEDSLQDKLDKLPKRAKSKALRIIEHLRAQLEFDSESGQFPGYTENLFNYLHYSVRGKQKPEDWDLFVPKLITLPLTLFSEKVKKEVKQVKRRHGRQVHTSRVDKLFPASST